MVWFRRGFKFALEPGSQIQIYTTNPDPSFLRANWTPLLNQTTNPNYQLPGKPFGGANPQRFKFPWLPDGTRLAANYPRETTSHCFGSTPQTTNLTGYLKAGTYTFGGQSGIQVATNHRKLDPPVKFRGTTLQPSKGYLICSPRNPQNSTLRRDSANLTGFHPKRLPKRTSTPQTSSLTGYARPFPGASPNL